ncbi:MAG: hypothetical protein JWM96_586 [Alphaproteobacteria bacterium]|nr:hypothetical protein [Alphaproteobacteria bacterium]
MANTTKPLVVTIKKFGKTRPDRTKFRFTPSIKEQEIVQIGRFLRNMDEVFLGQHSVYR